MVSPVKGGGRKRREASGEMARIGKKEGKGEDARCQPQDKALYACIRKPDRLKPWAWGSTHSNEATYGSPRRDPCWGRKARGPGDAQCRRQTADRPGRGRIGDLTEKSRKDARSKSATQSLPWQGRETGRGAVQNRIRYGCYRFRVLGV